MLDKMKVSIAEKYGQNFDYWVDLVKKASLEKHGQMVKLLKEDHGFSHGFANLVVHHARDSAALNQPEGDLIENQYRGKENLIPIYEKLISEVQKFGHDVELSPKKAYMSLRRKKQFALIQPSTKSRIDIGICCKNMVAQGNLEPSGSFNSMASFKIKITGIERIDNDVIGWLKESYDQAG